MCVKTWKPEGQGWTSSWDYKDKGVTETWMERHCGLQKGPWMEGSALGSLTGKVPSKGSSETEPFRGTFRWRPEQDLQNQWSQVAF